MAKLRNAFQGMGAGVNQGINTLLNAQLRKQMEQEDSMGQAPMNPAPSLSNGMMSPEERLKMMFEGLFNGRS